MKMILPLKNYGLSSISSSYGKRNYGDGWHAGVDFACPIGTPVLAVLPGKVSNVRENYSGGLGKKIVIDHGNGYSTEYGHLSTILGKVGDKVIQGQQIAKSGNTGNSTGPHLHFQLNDKNAPLDPDKQANTINPLPYLRGEKELNITYENTDPTPGESTGTIEASNIPAFLISEINNFNPHIVKINQDIKRDTLLWMIKTLLNKSTIEEVDNNLISPEFLSIKLSTGTGESFSYDARYFLENPSLVLEGSLGISNSCHVYLSPYKMHAILDNGINSRKTLANLEHGYVDDNPNGLPIINKYADTYLQANLNQIKATRQNFLSQKDMQEKNEKFSIESVSHINNQMKQNARYSVEEATKRQKYGQIEGIYSGIHGAVQGMMEGNSLLGSIAGGFFGAIKGGYTGYKQNDFLALNTKRANFNSRMTDEENALRSEKNTLSNLQAKIAIKNSIDMYNASLKDIYNQPPNVQKIGDNIAYPFGYHISTPFINIKIPEKTYLENANIYFHLFGKKISFYGDNLKEITKYKKDFTYIECDTVDLSNLDINSSHKETILAILQSGVRIWNHFPDNGLNYESKNEDNEENIDHTFQNFTIA